MLNILTVHNLSGRCQRHLVGTVCNMNFLTIAIKNKPKEIINLNNGTSLEVDV